NPCPGANFRIQNRPCRPARAIVARDLTANLPQSITVSPADEQHQVRRDPCRRCLSARVAVTSDVRDSGFGPRSVLDILNGVSKSNLSVAKLLLAPGLGLGLTVVVFADTS